MGAFEKQFEDINRKMLLTYKDEVLEKVREETEYALTENIQENMYRAYNPLRYKRTYNFLNSIDSMVNITNKKMESLVFFDRMKLDHMRGKRRVYVPMLVQTNEPRRNEDAWHSSARRDTAFYAETTLAMMKEYYNRKKILEDKKMIY